MPIERKPITRNIGAYRQSHEPPVFCVISLSTLAFSVKRIATRIRRDEATYGSAGTYLYVTPDGTAYLVRDEMSCTQRWIREHLAWLVGFYTRLPNPDKGLSMEAERMAEDIAEHLHQFNSAADGRQCVGLQQTGEANSLQSAPAVASSMRPDPSGAPDTGDTPAAGGGALQHHSEEKGNG